MTTRVLLTGATGFLGQYVAAEVRRRKLTLRTAGRSNCDVVLDLDDPAGFAAVVAESKPDLVIHCGAMSTMGSCQAEPTRALRVNGRAPRQLAAAASCRFVQISTDLVFGGDAAPYHSISLTQPLSVYGMSKAEAEQRPEAVATADWLVVRLPLLFGPSVDGRRGATDMLRAGLGAKERMTLFTDEFRTPIHAEDAARGVVDLACDEAVCGIRHVAGGERLSRWEFAQRFFAAARLAADAFAPGQSEDPRRPKDVSLAADWTPERSLDRALAAS